jgi:hypothetical protein
MTPVVQDFLTTLDLLRKYLFDPLIATILRIIY